MQYSNQKLLLLLVPFNGRFSTWTWSDGFPLGLPAPRVPEQDVDERNGVFTDATQPSVSKHRREHSHYSQPVVWSHLILSSSTTKLLTEGALIPFRQISRPQYLEYNSQKYKWKSNRNTH